MAKIIDISSKLTNERPVLKLSEQLTFPIDDRKNTILTLKQQMEQMDLNDPQHTHAVLELLLGQAAVEQIEALNLSMTEYQYVFIAVMAGATGEEFEAMEQRFLESRSS